MIEKINLKELLKNLSIIIPVYNEEDLLPYFLERLKKFQNQHSILPEIIFVDDCSRDKSLIILNDFIKDYAGVFKIISHKKNYGIGKALKTGFREAKRKWITFCPVDSFLSAEDIIKLITPLINNNADFVVTYRVERPGYTFLMRLNSFIYTTSINKFYCLKIQDYNWIHAYKSNFIKTLPIVLDGIGAQAEIIIKLLKRNAKYKEIPLIIEKRKLGNASAKKIFIMFKTFIELLYLLFCIKIK